jgi:hypothetical protein
VGEDKVLGYRRRHAGCVGEDGEGVGVRERGNVVVEKGRLCRASADSDAWTGRERAS